MKQTAENTESDIVEKKEYTPYVEIKIIMSMIFLLAFGLIMIYSASGYTSLVSSSVTGNDAEYYLTRQIRNTLFGLVFMLLTYIIPYGIYKYHPVLIYMVSVVLIVLLSTSQSVSSHGAERWLKIGPLQIQVADVLKLCMIMVMATMISHFWQRLDKRRYILLIWLVVAVPTLVLVKISSNLSSGIILALMCFSVTFVCSRDVKLHFITLVLAIVAVICVIQYCKAFIKSGKDINELDPYQLKRVVAWLDPDYDDDASYQSTQAIYAIGSGGLLGKGLGNGTQKLSRVSESQNDFIFAVICEELGIVGVLLLLLMYGYLLYHIYIVIRESKNVFASTVCLGIFIHILWQIIVNIFVVVGIFPNTGASLPFISYGGTALMFTMGEMGLVIGIRRQQITHRYDRFMKELAQKHKMKQKKRKEWISRLWQQRA